jgi:UDP-N-acetylglucosamine 2-epimerase
MSREAVDEYYRAWETLGIACYDADYPRLFMDSRAMITDCGSFLVEYAVTGLPIVHLKPLTNQVEIMPPNRRLFDSYYVASDVNRMLEIFDAVLERGEDPRREDRLRAVRESGLCDRNASNRILSYLDRLFGLPVSGRNW